MSGKIAYYILLLGSFGKLAAALEPEQYFSFLTDFVYMQRYHVKDQPLVTACKNGNCETGLTTKSLLHDFEPGLCATLSYIQNARSSYELSGLYVWPMDNSGSQSTRGGKSISFPFQNVSLTTDFSAPQKIHANYFSQFYTVEANYWKVFSSSRTSFFAVSGMFGLRFANIREKFTLKAYQDTGHSTYEIKSYNDLIGLQVGLDFKIRAIKTFYWDLLLKAGADLNCIRAGVFLGDLDNTVILRNNKAEKAQTGMFAQAAAGAGYQPYDFLDIHVGYQMLFFGGLALAPDQIDKSNSTLGVSSIQSRFKMNANGYIILHGIYTGLTFTF